MAEPRERATELLHVTREIVRWRVTESRLGGLPGEAYALDTVAGQILIDPLPLAAAALAALEKRGRISAILLTIQSHQRSAWRYAKKFNVPVFAPRGSQQLEGHWLAYQENDLLPGNVSAIALPGPAFSEHGLVWRSAEGRILFCGDLLSARGHTLHFVPDEYMDAPALARASVRKLLHYDWAIICPGHGLPLHGNSSTRLRAVLRADEKHARRLAPARPRP